MNGSFSASKSTPLPGTAELPEITSPKLFDLQREVLSHIALGGGFQDVLDRLCHLIETKVPGGLTSVMVKRMEEGLLYIQAGP